MKRGTLMGVPVLLVTLVLLAALIRAEDEAKRTPSEPSKAADARANYGSSRRVSRGSLLAGERQAISCRGR
jgi:hypothetical protein